MAAGWMRGDDARLRQARDRWAAVYAACVAVTAPGGEGPHV
jgi:hypothetical protein